MNNWSSPSSSGSSWPGYVHGQAAKPPGEVPVEYRDSVISLDLLTHDASCRGETVHMWPTEYRLLAYLALNHNCVLSHQELLDKVWGNDRGVAGFSEVARVLP